MTDEQKKQAAANLAKAREAKRQKQNAEAKAAALPEPEIAGTEVEAEVEREETFAPPVPAEGGEYVGPEVTEPEAEPAAELTPFQRFVLSLDPETRDLLDDDDLVNIWQEQQVKARAERKAAAKKAVTDKALVAARIAEGVIAPASAAEIAWKERMAEPVDFTVYMPILGGIAAQGVDVGPVDIGLRVDSRIFMDGHRYRLTRAQFDSMRDILFRAQQNEMMFEGKGLLRRMQLARAAIAGEALQ